ncbi:hypothetical protein [Lactococcus allomyrinae]|uniref:Uncharacterized protein n=1 Tax=Lactococcus allomyrinae TaxID=2419773 RepID=A0A387B7D2_9LACT|nr:hypothetical protein [Lactococcus allomyrinae]AYF99674.1 hypothetical protein D7I46_00350 [Lactococcus allomyrinae]
MEFYQKWWGNFIFGFLTVVVPLIFLGYLLLFSTNVLYIIALAIVSIVCLPLGSFVSFSSFKYRVTPILSYDSSCVYYGFKKYKVVSWSEIAGIELVDSTQNLGQRGENTHESLIFIDREGKMIFGLNSKKLREDSLNVWVVLTDEWHKHHMGKKMVKIR